MTVARTSAGIPFLSPAEIFPLLAEQGERQEEGRLKSKEHPPRSEPCNSSAQFAPFAVAQTEFREAADLNAQ